MNQMARISQSSANPVDTSNGAEFILIEPTFEDAIMAIQRSVDLKQLKKREWLCSLRRIAAFLDKPLSLLPARLIGVRISLDKLHHAQLGVSKKTLDNHRANVRAAMKWMRNGQLAPSRGAPLSGRWQHLYRQLEILKDRAYLSGFFRYCSASEIDPLDITEGSLDAYLQYRETATNLNSGIAARRAIVRAWNRCCRTIAGWPPSELLEPPPRKTCNGPEFSDFPEGLRQDIQAYIESRRPIVGLSQNPGRKPWKDSTRKACRAKLLAAVRTAVRCGIELEKIQSLSDLVNPSIAEQIIDAYWQANGETPKVATIDLGSVFLTIARETNCLADSDLACLKEFVKQLERHRTKGLTPKNSKAIREAGTPQNYRRLICLPDIMLKQALSARRRVTNRVAVIAQIAVAIRLLCFAPIRLGNLSRIRISENLIKPSGPGSNYVLHFPAYDVKNRIDLEYPLNEESTGLIDVYIHEYRPALLRKSNEDWLFPGQPNGPKGSTVLGGQISKQILKYLGLKITAHQFRHIAAKAILDAQPGNYELARRVLGHKNIQSTTHFYTGLETEQASKLFGDMVAEQIANEDAGDV